MTFTIVTLPFLHKTATIALACFCSVMLVLDYKNNAADYRPSQDSSKPHTYLIYNVINFVVTFDFVISDTFYCDFLLFLYFSKRSFVDASVAISILESSAALIPICSFLPL